MIKYWLLISVLAISLAGLSPIQADSASIENYIRDLAQPETQRQALEQIRGLADPAFKPILVALKDGALYRWNDRFFILDESGNLHDLEGTALLDTSGQPFIPEEGLEQVQVEEANFSLLHQALDLMGLFDPDPGGRRSAALKLGNLEDRSVGPWLEKAIAQERDPTVKGIMLESLNKLRLLDPDPVIRLSAVEFFGHHRSEAALGLFNRILMNEPDPQVKKAIEQTIGEIQTFIQIRNGIGYLFNGLSLASILLIMSLGLAITFGLMGIINMAHGEMLMLGSYTAYVVQELFYALFPPYQDYYFFLALPLSFLVVGLVGLLLEGGLLRFLYGRPLESLLVTWGIGMVLQQGARLYFGDQTSVNPPTWFRGGWEVLPGLVLPTSRIFIIALSLLSLLLIYLLLYRSRTGLKVRAVMQNREMASCMGISTRRVDGLTFALGTALAGLAGCALSLIGTVDPEVGKTYIVDSFMVVVLGGVGKLSGTVLASFGIGMGNKILEPAIGGTAAAVYAKVVILALVVLFLQLKPTGLFPAKERVSEIMGR